MKKLSCVLLSIALLFLCGCTVQQNVPPTTDPSYPTQPKILRGSDVFTNAFFADVIEIRAMGCEAVDKEQMGPVVMYLQNLNLIETDEHLRNVNENGELLYGLGLLSFVKSDGTEVIFLNNHAKMTLSDGSCSYLIVGDNLNAGLREAFHQAHNDNDDRYCVYQYPDKPGVL